MENKSKSYFKKITINGKMTVIRVYMTIKDIILVERREGNENVYNFYLPEKRGSKAYKLIMPIPIAILDEFVSNKINMSLKTTTIDANGEIKEIGSALDGASIEDLLKD